MVYKVDMNNHLDSILMTVLTVGLYYFNHALANLGLLVIGLIPADLISGAVIISAITTAMLNVYKAYQLWKDYHKNKSSNKNKVYDPEQ